MHKHHGRQMERQELDALVGFLVASHPIPALPVVCGKGEGSSYSESVASSHDLLANGIRYQVLHIHSFSHEHLKQTQAEKNRILEELHNEVVQAWHTHLHPDSSSVELDVVQQCYVLLCGAARAYQAQYPGTPDMRITPMADVCRGSTVHAQALSHIRAREQSFEGDGIPDCLKLTDTHKYSDIIRAYVQHMAAMAEPEPQHIQ